MIKIQFSHTQIANILKEFLNSDDLDPGIPGDVDPLFLRA